MGQNGTGQSHRQYGAADSVRHETGIVRFKVYDEGYPASVDAMRDALGDNGFDSAWAEGTALSTLEAIAYARRGHSDRERPTSGWDALTPTEHDVVRLVTEGLANKDIATGSSSRRELYGCNAPGGPRPGHKHYSITWSRSKIDQTRRSSVVVRSGTGSSCKLSWPNITRLCSSSRRSRTSLTKPPKS